MLSDKLLHHKPIDGFRWRSHEITRVEGFSDAVFGFAVTLLIVSLEVPHTSTELLDTMRGFGAFLVTFFILAALWYSQFTFFRRYALEDRVTVILNLALMFMVLFFVYPLKFIFTRLAGGHATILPQHKPIIFGIFGAGYVGVMLVFLLMYRHAYRQRDELGLNEFETYETEHTLRRLRVAITMGFMYFVIAAVEALPHRSESEKRTVNIASIAVLVIILLLFARLMRMQRARRRVKAEWLERQQAQPPHAP